MIELLHGDCMEYMRTLPDKAFDLCSADPPYFKGVGKMGFFGKKQSSIGVKRGNYNIPNWDNNLPDNNWFEEVKRVSRNQIIWGANYFEFIGTPHATPRPHELNEWIEKHPTGWIIWDKINGNSSFNSYELAWTSYNMPTHIFKFMWNGMNQGKSLSEPTTMQGNKRLNQKRIHPTQKPVQLYQYIFSLGTFNGPVFETHIGSGSAAIAAYKLGIDLVGTELDKDYYDAAATRLANHQKQLSLL